MSYFQAVFLAVVQGLTEFLPVSSSGHLVIFQKFFGLNPPILFDVLVHVGTLMAVLFYFKKELISFLKGILRAQLSSIKISLLVLVGTVPAVLVGLFLEKHLDRVFNSLTLVSFSLLVTAGLLFSTKKAKPSKLKFSQLEWPKALVVGCFQAVAILPGISRSGATIVSGLWQGLDRKAAFRFSFFLAIPAILGALVLQIPEITCRQFNQLNEGILGMIIAGLVGYFALKVLEKVLLRSRLWIFGFYCLALGLLAYLSKI